MSHGEVSYGEKSANGMGSIDPRPTPTNKIIFIDIVAISCASLYVSLHKGLKNFFTRLFYVPLKKTI